MDIEMKEQVLDFDKEALFLVTGGAGFIGSNICETLLNMGYRVRCLDNLSTGKIENVNMFMDYPRYSFIKGDITDFITCMKACEGVQYVLHQAAWGSVPRSMKVPLNYQKNNIEGTVNMMEAARKCNVDRFIYASSSSVYGDSMKLPKTEGIEGKILSPYGLTKKVCEEYGVLYKELYGLNTYGLRYFNVFGKRQNPDSQYAAVIPKFIKKLMCDEQPLIYGDGKQSRDFTYVENVVEANLRACKASSEFAGQVFNIANGEREFLIDVYNLIMKLLGKNIEPQFTHQRKGDIRDSNADISKANMELGYTVKYTFEEGIRYTVEWYKKYYKLI